MRTSRSSWGWGSNFDQKKTCDGGVMFKMGRSELALIVTPAIVTLVSFFSTPLLLKAGIFWSPWLGSQHASDVDQQISDFVRAVGGNYLSFLCFGIPTLVVLRKINTNGWKAYLVAGILAAVIPSFVGYELFAFGDSGAEFTLRSIGHILLLPFVEPRSAQWLLLPPSIFGPTAAIIYWAIARPDHH